MAGIGLQAPHLAGDRRQLLDREVGQTALELGEAGIGVEGLDLAARALGQGREDRQQVRGLRPLLRVVRHAQDAVRLRPPDLERDRVGVVDQADPRLFGRVRLGHLLGAVAQRHDPRGLAQDHRLGQREQLDLEAAVERARDVARQLQMLLLVLAHRHMGRPVGQDVGRHQDRVGVEADRGVLAILPGLLLELGHAVEPAQRAHAAQHPGQLRMRRHAALREQDRTLGIDASREQGRCRLAGVGPHLRGRVQGGQRVLVDQAIDAVILRLQPHPVTDGA